MLGVAAGEVEHAVVEGVEAGQGDELELVAHGAQFALELGDLVVVEGGLPVERGRAVVREHLVRVLRVDRLGELAGLGQVRGAGLDPDEVGVRGVGQAAGDNRGHAVLHPVEALGGALAGRELGVTLVDVAGQQVGRERVRAGDDQGGGVRDVGGEAGRVEGADVLGGRDEDLAAEVAALLLRGELVLVVDARRAGRDHRLGQLEGVQRTAEAGLGVGHDRRQPVRRVGAALGRRDLVGPQQRVVDPTDHLRDGVDRVQGLVRVGVPGLVGVGGHLPAGQVDRLQPGAHLLHGLAAGQRAERVEVVERVQLPPQPLGAAPGQGVLLADTAGKPDHVLGGVGALDARPAGVRGPPLLELLGRRRRVRVCHDRHRLHESLGLPTLSVSDETLALCALIGSCGRRPHLGRS